MSSRWSLLPIFAIGLILISPLPELAINAGVGEHAPSPETTPKPAKPETPAKAKESPATAPEAGAPRRGHAKGLEHEELLSPGRTVVLLLEKLGEALIIAAILGFAVDEAVKRSLVTEITRDGLDFAVGFELPQEVKEQVRFVLRLPFVRRNVRVTYEFNPAPAGATPPYVAVVSTSEYEVTNLTGSAKYFDFKSSIETARGEGLPENQLLLMEVPTLHEKVTGAELAGIAHLEGPYRKAKIPVEIGGHRSKPVTFRTERLAHYRLKDAIVLDLLEPPIIGITVAVVAPAEFDFRVSFETEGEVTVRETGGRREWFHPGVHLPGSHFRLQWEYRRQAAPVAHEQST